MSSSGGTGGSSSNPANAFALNLPQFPMSAAQTAAVAAQSSVQSSVSNGANRNVQAAANIQAAAAAQSRGATTVNRIQSSGSHGANRNVQAAANIQAAAAAQSRGVTTVNRSQSSVSHGANRNVQAAANIQAAAAAQSRGASTVNRIQSSVSNGRPGRATRAASTVNRTQSSVSNGRANYCRGATTSINHSVASATQAPTFANVHGISNSGGASVNNASNTNQASSLNGFIVELQQLACGLRAAKNTNSHRRITRVQWTMINNNILALRSQIGGVHDINQMFLVHCGWNGWASFEKEVVDNLNSAALFDTLEDAIQSNRDMGINVRGNNIDNVNANAVSSNEAAQTASTPSNGDHRLHLLSFNPLVGSRGGGRIGRVPLRNGGGRASGGTNVDRSRSRSRGRRNYNDEDDEKNMRSQIEANLRKQLRLVRDTEALIHCLKRAILQDHNNGIAAKRIVEIDIEADYEPSKLKSSSQFTFKTFKMIVLLIQSFCRICSKEDSNGVDADVFVAVEERLLSIVAGATPRLTLPAIGRVVVASLNDLSINITEMPSLLEARLAAMERDALARISSDHNIGLVSDFCLNNWVYDCDRIRYKCSKSHDCPLCGHGSAHKCVSCPLANEFVKRKLRSIDRNSYGKGSRGAYGRGRGAYNKGPRGAYGRGRGAYGRGRGRGQ
eukprot:862838_1